MFEKINLKSKYNIMNDKSRNSHYKFKGTYLPSKKVSNNQKLTKTNLKYLRTLKQLRKSFNILC